MFMIPAVHCLSSRPSDGSYHSFVFDLSRQRLLCFRGDKLLFRQTFWLCDQGTFLEVESAQGCGAVPSPFKVVLPMHYNLL